MFITSNTILLLVIATFKQLFNNLFVRSFRFAGYKQFAWYVFGRLGKGNRRVLPSCVVQKIRKTFPEADGKYALFTWGKD